MESETPRDGTLRTWRSWSTPGQHIPPYPGRCCRGWKCRPGGRCPPRRPTGESSPFDVVETTIRLEGLQFHTPVIFAEAGEPSLLGMVSLGEAALTVDPLAGRLIPVNLLRL